MFNVIRLSLTGFDAFLIYVITTTVHVDNLTDDCIDRVTTLFACCIYALASFFSQTDTVFVVLDMFSTQNARWLILVNNRGFCIIVFKCIHLHYCIVIIR